MLLPRRSLTRHILACALALSFTRLPLHALDAPVSPNPQPGVAQLMTFLHGASGQYVLAGQQESMDWFGVSNPEQVAFIERATGRLPAVRGFDYIFHTHPQNPYRTVSDNAIAWARQGGIVTIACHLFTNIGSPAGNPQFYVPSANNGVGTSFDIRQAVITGTPENTELLEKLDLLAGELKKLRDAGVPVIWRPFHECSGNWFWWGVGGAAAYKQLWRITFERFTQRHGLNNLIWCFNPTGTGAALGTNLENWYPGDDVVDMISLDVYPPAGTHPTFAADYQRMRDFRPGRKVIAMSENGAIPDPDAMFTEGAGWSYFCTWNGFENNAAQNTTAFLNRVYNHAKVITLDELPALYTNNAWAITTQPKTQLVIAGAPLLLSVAASTDGPLTYQWSKDGAALTGATAATYTVPSANSGHAGSYTVTVTGPAGTLTSAAAIVGVAATDDGRLANLSVLAEAGTGDRTLIVGFVMTGSGTPKDMLLRGIGPALGPLGVANFLADPHLQLNTTPLIVNDDWGNNAATPVATFTETFERLGVEPRPPAGSKDAALLVPLAGGAYSASITGMAGGTGAALAEIFDTASTRGARLVNIAARSQVGGGGALVAGFVIIGDARTVLIRAVGGKALSDLGVSGALTNPRLDLYRGQTLIASNDEWSTGETAQSTLVGTFNQVGAGAIPSTSHDSALLVTLAPGVYSARVNAADTGSGVALVEIYEVR